MKNLSGMVQVENHSLKSLTLPFPKSTFQIQDTLCVPTINKNLILVHHFTKHNNVFLKFHPTCFLVRD